MSQTVDHLYNRIVDELEHGGITGWCPVQKALELASAVVALRPKIAVETGVWGGRSLLPMALACEAIDCGVVIGIDPWSPMASAEGYSGDNEKWWGQQDHEAIYQGFLGHVGRLGLKNRVAIERAKSDDAAVPQVIDLLHLDGQHTEQAVREVKRFAANVRVGGIVCMDDLGWVNDGVPHVELAVKELLNTGFTELHHTYTDKGAWGFFQRISLPATPPEPTLARSGTDGALAASRRTRRAKK